MANGVRCLVLILVIIVSIPSAFAQTTTQTIKSNSLYQPLPVVMRLSYENFKCLKLLNAAIVNYGGGETELERLIDQYAEASALYFQNKVDESADKFTENSQEILKVSQKLAQIYKQDAEKILVDAMKMNIKRELNNSIMNKNANETAAKYLEEARSNFKKADGNYTGFINTTTASPTRLISVIYYYRRAKESVFSMYQSLDMDSDKAKDAAKKELLLINYKKDIQDNKNKVYFLMEKIN